jgi:tetratricopeptide (TPR) repeat protein
MISPTQVGKGLLGGALLLALLIGAAPASAQSDDERARFHFQAGRSYFEQGRYEESVREWSEAYRLSDRHVLLINIANAQERLFRFNDAIRSLQRYLQVGGPEAEQNRNTIQSRIAGLQRLARQMERSGEQQQTTTPPETTPTPQDTTQPADTTTPPTTTEPLDTEPGVGDASTPQPSEAGPISDEPAAERPKRLWTWVTLGATGLFTVGAVVTGVLALQDFKELEENCPNNVCTDASMQDTIDRGNALAITTDVLIGLAGAAAAATIALIFLEPRLQRRNQNATALVPVLSPRHVGLALQF